MARHSAALTSLCNCLRGMPPVNVEWTPVIGLANQTLTTPALIDFVDKFALMLPEDVCTYIRQIHRRNVLRNNRLIAQLEEAVVAMNSLGITPIMLKGASTLATAPEERRGVRLMSDLDIMIMPRGQNGSRRSMCNWLRYRLPGRFRKPEMARRAESVAGCRHHRPAAGSSRSCVPLPELRACAEPLRPCAAGTGTRLYPQAYLPSAHVDHP